ncbi:hypothetical protein ACRE_050410 [Hapsidospora chrysogenum ATCC 11550]|uniref:Uncharacterized protein n=1 Tax=Hapsidospora chrysogenum (strain ATCC 11550 / CBS 779.69 / DSM 880 / IAM 14645 / JCM 23072 / IMI 49137) TaxID=857340 RepID=A0A086T4A3_HAPC1|nr:hypothetical protein ACRE_050410 [Hapsidospora chrysogenum ATCC 11550]
MDTLSNVATAATKAVWGGPEANKEPVSGAQGDVTKGEPYDAGNLDDEEQNKIEKRLSGDDVAEESKNAPTISGSDPTKAQSDTRDPAVPSTDPIKVEEPGRDPNQHVGFDHGGEAAQMAGGALNPRPMGSATGTGQQHVKSTGVAADGGDFDATKPGAGKEAERILEEKGVGQNHQIPSAQQPATPNGNKTSSASSPGSHPKAKPSLSQRIKAKLHRH